MKRRRDPQSTKAMLLVLLFLMLPAATAEMLCGRAEARGRTGPASVITQADVQADESPQAGDANRDTRPKIRKAAVAGSFYPQEAGELEAVLESPFSRVGGAVAITVSEVTM